MEMGLGKFREHVACTYTDCTSTDGLAIYEDEDTGVFTGFCFVCSRYVNNPYDSVSSGLGSILSNKIFIKREDSLTDIDSLTCADDSSRLIRAESFRFYNGRTELSEGDGRTVTGHYYPYTRDNQIVAYKYRRLPKELTCVGDFKNVELFGQAQARVTASKRLYITEGEIDCITVYQVLKDHAQGGKWADYDPAVVSICNGANAAVRDISRNMAFVRGFESVVLVFDQDEAGKKATEEVLKLLPTALVASFDEKDPNEMLLKGKSTQLQKALLFNAKKYRPASIVTVEDLYDRALEKPTMGLSWPWPTLSKATYGIHRKRIYSLGSGVGMGKTEFVKQLQEHLITAHSLTVGTFSLEEDGGRTLKGIAGKMDGTMYHRPDATYDEQRLRNALDKLKGKLLLYDHRGVKDWSDIKPAIRYMVVAEGIKDIFIDPITALVAHLSASEANDVLNAMMADVSGLVHELDCSIYLFSHLNLPTSGPPHERGGKVLESQFTGSRAVMKWSDYVLGMEGNKDPDLDEVQRNTRYITTLKDRAFGNVCRFPIFYDNISGSLLEPEFHTGVF